MYRLAAPERAWALQLRHHKGDGVSNHQPHDRLLNRLFRRRSKEISKLCVTGLCGENSQVTGEFPAQRASNAENVSSWWRRHRGLQTCIHQIAMYHHNCCIYSAERIKQSVLDNKQRPVSVTVKTCHKDTPYKLETERTHEEIFIFVSFSHLTSVSAAVPLNFYNVHTSFATNPLASSFHETFW